MAGGDEEDERTADEPTCAPASSPSDPGWSPLLAVEWNHFIYDASCRVTPDRHAVQSLNGPSHFKSIRERDVRGGGVGTVWRVLCLPPPLPTMAILAPGFRFLLSLMQEDVHNHATFSRARPRCGETLLFRAEYACHRSCDHETRA